MLSDETPETSGNGTAADPTDSAAGGTAPRPRRRRAARRPTAPATAAVPIEATVDEQPPAPPADEPAPSDVTEPVPDAVADDAAPEEEDETVVPAVTDEAAGTDAAPRVEPAVTDSAAGSDAVDAPAVDAAVTDSAAGATTPPPRRRRAARRPAAPAFVPAVDTAGSDAAEDATSASAGAAATGDDEATDGGAPVAAAVPPVPTFRAPDVSEAPRRRRRAASRPTGGPQSVDEDAAATEEPESGSDDEADEQETSSGAGRGRSRGRGRGRGRGPASDDSDDDGSDTGATTDGSASDDEGDDRDDRDDDAGSDDGPRRRRRRGRRGRGRARSDDEGSDASSSGGSDDEDGSRSGSSGRDSSGRDSASRDSSGNDTSDDDEGDSGEGGGSSRRRRRRRRGGSGGGGGSGSGSGPGSGSGSGSGGSSSDGDDDDADDGVRGIQGSTRMEAKRQRRRDGRDSGRRRPQVLSEAEFLARRDNVERVMVVRQRDERVQVAVLEDGVLVEHFTGGSGERSMVGDIYLGKVQNVLPSMEAAFVDVGRGRNGVLYAGEVNWAALGVSGGDRQISKVLKSGQDVLVQVSKDPVGHKGARLTGQIALPGRYVVYVPDGSSSGISRKLPENERARLKAVLKKAVPEGASVIVRTAAEGAAEADLERDVRRLQAQWEVVQSKVSSSKGPVQLYAEPDLVVKVVRDLFNEDVKKLVVQGDDAWDTVSEYVRFVAPDLVDRMEKHEGDEDVFAAQRVDEQLAKALDRKVHLPSGGSLVIDHTEAMTVVDVNTGRYTGSGGNLEETVTRNNLEAAEEIVRQLRLRDVGGIIVIDFIDMVLEHNRDLVMRRLVECLGRDRTKHQVAEVTSLGLVQMTRKRVGQSLLDEFSEQCATCGGLGRLVHDEPVVTGSSDGRSGGDRGGSERSGGGRGRGGRSRSGGGSGGGSGSSGSSGGDSDAPKGPPSPATVAAAAGAGS